jgi:pyruvate,water dikinase
MVTKTGSVLRFSAIEKDAISLVGEASLPYGELLHAGFAIPPGFVITSQAYFQFLKQNNLTTKIKHMLSTVNFDRPESLLQTSSYIRRYIKSGEISDDLIADIFGAYKELGGVFHQASVMIRTSETSSHLFRPGELEHNITFHDITGESNVLLKIKEVWASLFEAHAIFRRQKNDISHFTAGMAVIVQKLIPSEASGTLFTIDPILGNRNRIVIEARRGITEPGKNKPASPDQYIVSKADLLINKKTISEQTSLYRRAGPKVLSIKLTNSDSNKQKITDTMIEKLATLGRKLEHAFYFPQQVDWAIEKGKIYVVQAKPLTLPLKKPDTLLTINQSPLVATGTPASPGIATGRVKIILSEKDLNKLAPHDILVTKQPNELFTKAIKKAAAVVSEDGGLTSHAAFLTRSLGIPAVMHVKGITTLLKQDQIITVNGSTGTVSKGSLSRLTESKNSIFSSKSHKIATKLYLLLKNSEAAVDAASLPADGLGIFSAESLFTAEAIHPKKLLKEEKSKTFITKLVEELKPVAQAFHPRPVVYKAADLTTASYRLLKGGKQFEQTEENPLLGYHGTYRTMHDTTLFSLELDAIKTLRNKHTIKNISLLIPYIRTIHEFNEIKRIIAAAGLHRSPSFKIYVQIQLPINAFMLESFIDAGIDGVDIDIDTLTVLLMGTDNGNEEVHQVYDPVHPGVLAFLESLIKRIHKYTIPVTISGRAVARHPLLIEKAIQWGVTGVTTEYATFEGTHETIARAEKKILIKK